MAFKKPANSRDDRSSKPSGRPSKSDSSSKRSASSSRGKSSDRSDSDNTKKRYSSGPAAERSSFSAGGEKKSFGPRKPYSGRPSGDGEERTNKRGYGEQAGDKKPFERKKPYSGRVTGDSTERAPKSFSGRSFSGDDRPKRSFGSDSAPRNRKPKGEDFGDKPKRAYGDKPSGDRKFAGKPSGGGFKRDFDKPYDPDRPKHDRPKYDSSDKTMRAKKAPKKTAADDGLIRLNRYIANAGICSRRKADELIIAGVVSVNGEVINELGHKVDPAKDEIRYNGETLKREKSVYVLLNKPKDYITTTDDPQERRTVMHLVEKASRERIYPIGRLDRNTTGLLLMTNDGDLADKLSHPRSNITKIYQVELSKSLTQGDLNKLQFGLELEDGFIKPDAVSYVQGATKREIGVQIHSGKNRIVRRMFESLGYEVVKLDRVVYANLTKKDLPRGRWRFLDEKEIIQLKHLIK